MKLDIEKLTKLIATHVFELSLDELKAVCFLFDIQIDSYIKMDRSVEFKMTNTANTAYLTCFSKENLSMGKAQKVLKGVERMTSYGGQFSIGDAISTFRWFYCKSFAITLNGDDFFYTNQEKEMLFLKAIETVNIGI